MAADDAELRILISARNDASKGLKEAQDALDDFSRAHGRATESAIKFETTERKVEGAIKGFTFAAVGMATTLSQTQGGFQTAAVGVSFLSNALGSLTGPIGITITIVGTLAAALLEFASRSKEAEEAERAFTQAAQDQAEVIDKMKSEFEKLTAAQIEARIKGIEYARKHGFALKDNVIEMDLLTNAARKLDQELDRMSSLFKQIHSLGSATNEGLKTMELQTVTFGEGVHKAINLTAKGISDAHVPITDANVQLEDTNQLTLQWASNVEAGAQTTVDAMQQAAQAAGANAETMKDLAIMEAIVHTAAGVTQTFEQFGWWALLGPAEAVALAGAAQIAAIESSSPGGGTVPSVGSAGSAPSSSGSSPSSGSTGFGETSPQGSGTGGSGVTNVYIYVQGPWDASMLRRLSADLVSLGLVAPGSARMIPVGGTR